MVNTALTNAILNMDNILPRYIFSRTKCVVQKFRYANYENCQTKAQDSMNIYKDIKDLIKNKYKGSCRDKHQEPCRE